MAIGTADDLERQLWQPPHVRTDLQHSVLGMGFCQLVEVVLQGELVSTCLLIHLSVTESFKTNDGKFFAFGASVVYHLAT